MIDNFEKLVDSILMVQHDDINNNNNDVNQPKPKKSKVIKYFFN